MGINRGSKSPPSTATIPKCSNMFVMLRPLLLLALASACLSAQPNRGYYRSPAPGADGVIFVSEGDLWTAPLSGGPARRLTTHAAEENTPRVSPDGKIIGFTANYEGTPEVYTMPVEGGLPQRRSYGGGQMVDWTADGKILFRTTQYSGLPTPQLALLSPDNSITRVPLYQAQEGTYGTNQSGLDQTLFFARRPPNFSLAKRYRGGLAQTLWKFKPGAEAIPLTADYPGTSAHPMWWKGRVYFVTDRDGSMNFWSMDEAGKSLRQHTKHTGFDVKTPSLRDGKIAYQLGADVHLFDTATNQDRRIDISITSDFDHLRERWIKKPMEFLTFSSLSHEGDQLTLTSRGRVFVSPVQQGRFVAATGPKSRYRQAYLIPGTKDLLVLSSQSGELEWWRVPANGVGAGERLTTDGKVLRWGAALSPDGKKAIHSDKDNNLWLLDLSTKENKLLTHTDSPRSNSTPAFRGYRWSPDSRWLLFSMAADNDFERIWIYSVESAQLTPLTTDRYNSGDAVWSEDGKWIYFLSDRSLRSTVAAPWGSRAPDPHFDRSDKIYALALKKGLRSPFEPTDELQPKPGDKKEPEKKPETAKAEPKVEIDFDGLSERLSEVPVPAGNYRSLEVAAKRLCYLSASGGETPQSSLRCLPIDNKGDKPDTVFEGASAFGVSGNGKKMMLRKGEDFYVADAAVKSLTGKTLADAKVNLADWTFSVIPQEEFREAYFDAWRLHRDYFYDRNMHGVDWKLMRDKYGEFIGRIRDRAELSDLIGQLISELNVMHNTVTGGDLRQAPDQIATARLGAELSRLSNGNWKIEHIYRHDPDRPDLASPLARPGVNAKDGDAILAINGQALASVAHPGELLRNLVNKQVLLKLETPGQPARETVVRPIGAQQDTSLRYHEWEYTRRLAVEKAAPNQIGYVHLRAMGAGDIAQWAEHYYPVFDRQGLIIDVRHNNGGNIDSWILGKLMRKAWMFWQSRVGRSSWNMQYAFRGHIVVLVDERTASDGEAFADGFRRLGLGKVIGTRTWGGEIWLTSSNRLADQGVATAAENGVYGPNARGVNEWLVEGHGVDPDIVVDNLPHATFNGKDAQLEAAIRYLEEQIRLKPILKPVVPPYPDKSLKAPASSAGQ